MLNKEIAQMLLTGMFLGILELLIPNQPNANFFGNQSNELVFPFLLPFLLSCDKCLFVRWVK